MTAQASNPASIDTLLSKAKVCEGLAPEQLASLASLFSLERAELGDHIIEHDEQSKDVFIVCAGQVEVELPLIGAKIKTASSAIAKLGPGETVGEFALLRTSRRTATARAVSDVTLLRAQADALLQMFEVQPAIGYRIFRNMSRILVERLSDTNMQLRSALSRG